MSLERGRVDVDRLQRIGRELLVALGEDPDREGLIDTPKRWAKLWREFVEFDPGTLGTSFESVTSDQLVTVSGMRVWSMCEHHLIPFWVDVAIGYIPAGRVLGLSKFARIAHKYGHRLQLQERLTNQIAEAVSVATGSPDVGVVSRGQHLCMLMRGIKTPGTMGSTSFRGRFQESAVQSQFWQLVTQG